MDVTTAGAVHTLVATMPSVAGFSSANINFALNAPAVGATLPLQISGALVTGPVLGAGTGAVIPAGYIGNLKTSGTYLRAFSGTVGGTWRNITQPANPLVTEPGTWLIYGEVFSGTQTNLVLACLLDYGNNNDAASGSYSINQTQQNMTGTVWPAAFSSGPALKMFAIFTTTTTQTHYIKCYWDAGSTITSTISGYMNAVRIA